MMNKTPTSFRLSKEAKILLKRLSGMHGISQNGVVEMLLRKEARELGIDEKNLQDKTLSKQKEQTSS